MTEHEVEGTPGSVSKSENGNWWVTFNGEKTGPYFTETKAIEAYNQELGRQISLRF